MEGVKGVEVEGVEEEGDIDLEEQSLSGAVSPGNESQTLCFGGWREICRSRKWGGGVCV